jgi:hypothetical protein
VPLWLPQAFLFSAEIDRGLGTLLIRRFGDESPEIRKAFLKLWAAHLIAIHEHADQFARETVPAIHRPGHDGLVALGFKGEVHSTGAFNGPLPIHAHADEFAGLAFGDSAGTSTNVAVAIPTAARTDAGIRAAKGVLYVRIKFHERIPNQELVMIVRLLKQGCRSGGNRRAPLNPEISRTRGRDDEEDNDDGSEANENFLNHKVGTGFGFGLPRLMFLTIK